MTFCIIKLNNRLHFLYTKKVEVIGEEGMKGQVVLITASGMIKVSPA
jgi:hypothetical protein